MTFCYIPLFANELLSEEAFLLVKAGLTDAEKKVQDIAAFRDIDHIDVLVQAKELPPELPVTGFSPNPNRIEITIDPERVGLLKETQNDLLSKTFFHELHHMLRSRSVGYGKTLGEALVSEGLAQVFERETGHSKSAYSMNLSHDELLNISERARLTVLEKKPYIHTHWFFGTEGQEITNENFKRWSGYSLGFAIVAAWLERKEQKERNETAASAASIPAEKVLEPWLRDGEDFITAWIESTKDISA